MVEKKLTDYQIEILNVIVKDSIKTISYHNPQTQLRNITKGKSLEETLDALRFLESDFGVLALDPTLRFGIFSKCGYRVNLDQAKNLHDSYVKEKER